MTRTLFVLALGLTSILVPAAPAYAQDAQAQALGRALFEDGVALAKDGKWAEACPKFEASLKHLPGIGTRGKLAECYEKLGRFATAWALWREVAQLSMRAGEPTREQVASEHAKSLEPKLAYVTVVVPPANDSPGLVIKRNGQEMDRSKLGGAEPVDPGSIAFEVSAPGKKPFSAQVTVTQGQSAKFEVPGLENLQAPPGTAAPPSTAPSTPPGTSAPPSTDFPAPQTESTSWQRPVGLGVAGAGVVAVIVGSAFGLSAKSTYDKAFGSGGCDNVTRQCDQTGQSTVDDARSKATLSTVLFVAGAAFLAGGAVLFFTAPTPKAAGVRVVPTPYAGGAGLSIVGGM